MVRQQEKSVLYNTEVIMLLPLSFFVHQGLSQMSSPPTSNWGTRLTEKCVSKWRRLRRADTVYGQTAASSIPEQLSLSLVCLKWFVSIISLYLFSFLNSVTRHSLRPLTELGWCVFVCQPGCLHSTSSFNNKTMLSWSYGIKVPSCDL